MGNDNNQSISANRLHLIAWRSIMQEIHAGYEAASFPRPDRIVTATVCRDSGHLMTEFCFEDPRGSRGNTDIFDSRFVPTTHCQVHQQFTYCTEHGYLAGPFCESWGTVVTRVGIVRTVPALDPNINIWDRHMEFPIGVLEGLICPHHFYPNPNAGIEDPWDDGEPPWWANWNNQDDLPVWWGDPADMPNGWRLPTAADTNQWPPADHYVPDYWDDHTQPEPDPPPADEPDEPDHWGGESIPLPDNGNENDD